jgi:hypothetical protein
MVVENERSYLMIKTSCDQPIPPETNQHARCRFQGRSGKTVQKPPSTQRLPNRTEPRIGQKATLPRVYLGPFLLFPSFHDHMGREC